MKKNNGITLIALIITIIIMLILVAVTISILINSGLIGKAKEGAQKTKTSYEQEQRIGETINVDGTIYNSIDEYLGTTPGGENDTLTLTTPVETATESRASIVTVSLDVEEPTPSELAALGETELKQMLLSALQTYNFPCQTWTELETMFGGGNTLTVHEGFVAIECPPEIASDEYDLIIKTGTYAPPATFTCNGQAITTLGEAQFVITKNGEYTIVATKTNNGETETGRTTFTASKCKVEEFSSIQTTKQTLTIDGFTVTIPAGFAYGTSENVGHVTTGLVITDSVEVVDGKNYSNGNEFVWIPVDENLKVGTASNNKVMARISSGTDYEGVLYDFNGTGNSTTSTEKSNYGVSTTSWREPAYLNNSTYGDASSYNTIGLTQSSLQTEYNNMIASVKANKGFYVGRYEMGIENNKAVSKLGITPASAYDGCTNEETGEGALRWWGLYDKAKTYTNSSNSVQSHMIWGTEYDAMLNYALEGSDKGKINSTEYGNYGIKLLKTGTTATSDKIINIYDLGGNMWEWTTEAYTAYNRAGRGGNYNNEVPASYRNCSNPYNYNYHDSSRVALYIK